MEPAPPRLSLRIERAVQRVLRAAPAAATADLDAAAFRGRGCHCPPDLPRHFLHSEGLREACDFILDAGANVRPPGRPALPPAALRPLAARLAPGTTVHVKTDLLDDFVAHLLPVVRGPLVLVTGDSDLSQVKRHAALLDDPRIAHWFAQNCDVPDRHPRLTRLPIGLDNPVYTKLEKRLGFAVTMLLGRTPFDPTFSRNDIGDQERLGAIRRFLPAPRLRPRRVLCTFHQNQKIIRPDLAAVPVRAAAAAALRGNPCCEFVPGRLRQSECWRRHGRFAFEASPPGNGLDCFRTWEALALGTIPIVPSTPLDPLYRDEGLPVVIVSAWSEITPANLARWAEELHPRFDDRLAEKLSLAHWVGRIKKASQQAATA